MKQYKSHAKINRFLHVLKKRPDGLHDIQSLFQLIDLFDCISFKKRRDNKIIIKSNIRKLERKNIIYCFINQKNIPKKKYRARYQIRKTHTSRFGLGGRKLKCSNNLKGNKLYV